ncbi:MAG: pyridoxal-phosphate dependent enzyme [Bacteroidia bacterium]|nr:pyridoxal-phosphate dependent enzyme [Bacteroidia bacterium]
MLNIRTNPIIQDVKLPELRERHVKVLREDLVHPFTGGNKWRKLKYNLIDFREQNKKVLLTFGGAFSNHLIATSAAANQLGIDSIGIVRGDVVSNPCLQFMQENKMKIIFISREEYRLKNNEEFISALLLKLLAQGYIKNPDDVFILPEGGSNAAAVEGTAEMASELIHTENIFCACGTGATVAGLSKGIKSNQHIHGIPVLKAESFMSDNISSLGGDMSKITLHYDYHFGGYAKTSPELDKFCHDFYFLNRIQIEPVYTGKMFWALQDLLKKGTFPVQSSITAIHTGGIYPFFP